MVVSIGVSVGLAVVVEVVVVVVVVVEVVVDVDVEIVVVIVGVIGVFVVALLFLSVEVLERIFISNCSSRKALVDFVWLASIALTTNVACC